MCMTKACKVIEHIVNIAFNLQIIGISLILYSPTRIMMKVRIQFRQGGGRIEQEDIFYKSTKRRNEFKRYFHHGNARRYLHPCMWFGLTHYFYLDND